MEIVCYDFEGCLAGEEPMPADWLPSKRILKLRDDSSREEQLLRLEKKLKNHVESHRRGVRKAGTARRKMVNRLNHRLDSLRLKWRTEKGGLRLSVFGSSVMGLATKDSDVDLSIEGEGVAWVFQAVHNDAGSSESCRILWES